MTTHPLIASTEIALNAEGSKHGKLIHKHLTKRVQEIANLLGVRVELSQGMGAYSLSAEGAAYSYLDEPDTPGKLQDQDCLLDYIGEGYASRTRAQYTIHGMTEDGESKLREIAELCQWLSDAPHVPILGDIEAFPR